MTDNIVPMAWDEPGGGKRKDPWGRNQEGPPDLDKIFRDFQRKLAGIFGGGGGNGGGESSGGSQMFSFTFIIILVAFIYAVAGFYIVKPAEQAIVTRFGKHVRTVDSGPHWLPKFVEDKRIVNTEKIFDSRHSGNMLTEDENIVQVEMEVQYRIDDIEKYVFNVANPDKSLKEAAESALRQVVGHSTLDHVMTAGREQVAEQVKEQISETLSAYQVGIHVATVALRDVEAPEAVKAAFDDAIKAREEREQAKHEAEAVANKIVPEAEGQAERLRVEATAYKQEVINAAKGDAQRFTQVAREYAKAPDITTTRIYLDTMEEILGNTSKVLVDMEGGNQLIYLPIDRLLSKEDTASSVTELSDNLKQSFLQRNALNQESSVPDRRRRRRD